MDREDFPLNEMFSEQNIIGPGNDADAFVNMHRSAKRRAATGRQRFPHGFRPVGAGRSRCLRTKYVRAAAAAEGGGRIAAERTITRYLEATGNTAPIKSVDLVARVQGVLQSINYKDGTPVKAGATLFTIEPETYKLKLEQAQAAEAGAQAC